MSDVLYYDCDTDMVSFGNCPTPRQGWLDPPRIASLTLFFPDPEVENKKSPLVLTTQHKRRYNRADRLIFRQRQQMPGIRECSTPGAVV